MFSFFAVEKLVRLSASGDSHGHSHSHSHPHSHSHSHGAAAEPPKAATGSSKEGEKKTAKKENKESAKESPKETKDPKDSKDEGKKEGQEKKENAADECDHDHHRHGEEVNPEKIIGGLLNLFADTAHNFTDGMAIAASFMTSYQVKTYQKTCPCSKIMVTDLMFCFLLARNFHHRCRLLPRNPP